jgi:hypothetical protein
MLITRHAPDPYCGIFIALLVIPAFPVHGADTTADLTGTIKDSSGAVIPDALLTLVNTYTGKTLNDKTHDQATQARDPRLIQFAVKFYY